MNDRERELIRDYLDDRISKENLVRLNHLLETDANMRAEFRAMATLEEGLRDFSEVSESSFPKLLEIPAVGSSGTHPSPWRRTEILSIAALFVTCLILAAFLTQRSNPANEWGEAIAEIVFLSDDVSFATDHQLEQTAGAMLGKGWIRIETGRVHLLFRSGATVEVEGPAALGIATPGRAYLDYGMVSVHASEADFVVATESVEVVDLGTKFEIEVDRLSRESNVLVSEGLVDLHLGSRGSDRLIRPLGAGYAARVDAFGEIVEIVSNSDLPRDTQPNEAHILGHWTFDELTSGHDNVNDSTGNQLDGTLRANGEAGIVPGISGQAISLAPTTFVDLSEHVSQLGQLDSFTFAAWVRNPQAPLAMLFSHSGDSERHRIQFYLAARFVRFGWQNGLHFDSISGRVPSWEPNRWYHVAVAVENGVARLYRDGKMIASGATGSNIGTPVCTPSDVVKATHSQLGRLVDGRQGASSAPQWYEGQLDDVQIYSGALSEEAIQSIVQTPGVSWRP